MATFSLSSQCSRFSPRVGTFVLSRDGVAIESPSITTSTTRGVVPHLSRDNHEKTQGIRWLHVPFESFLESRPPVPQGNLHSFLGFPSRNIVSLTLRTPSDTQILPTNGKDFVSAICIQGVRKVSPSDWRSFISSCKPDFAVALSDVPSTNPPHSQKRITKSIERSTTWLAHLLNHKDRENLPHVLVQMVGGNSIPARRAFADSLLEKLHGREADGVEPYKCLDEGVTGYVFDIAPLYLEASDTMMGLLQASLSSLPIEKPRFVNSVRSPHDILWLIRHVGIDMFDAHWAQRAADIGIALDFTFPVGSRGPSKRRSSKRDLGHNLYDISYSQDFAPLADCFRGKAETNKPDVEVCVCGACSPMSPGTIITHSSVDETERNVQEYQPPFSRAYLHHLLHTHEMSAHTLLVMHNLTVVDAMFASVRSVIKEAGVDAFETQVDRFIEEYDEQLLVLEEAAVMWQKVDLARGKGRLAREKKVLEESI